MDPTMLAAIATGQMAEYMDELERERDLRRHYGHRSSRPRRSWFSRILQRSAPRVSHHDEPCGESTPEAC